MEAALSMEPTKSREQVTRVRPATSKVYLEDVDSLPEKVKTLLDGRTQSWLALKLDMANSDLSNKMKGRFRFNILEVQCIATIFNVEFIIGPSNKPPDCRS